MIYDPDEIDVVFPGDRLMKAYQTTALRLIGAVIVFDARSFLEVRHNGQVGWWCHYGRNYELRRFIPKMYALMELTKEKER